MTSMQRCPWHHSARQQVLLDYTTLKEESPAGIYVASKPGNALRWTGILFVRKGPYAPAILRFNVSFPREYPYSPPTIFFSTDIFHPLVIPLTTYTYSTGNTDSETVSASDDDRLPPGGFSLRHGFPSWFGQVDKSIDSSPIEQSTDKSAALTSSTEFRELRQVSQGPKKPTIIQALDYVKRSFDQDDFLDDLPLDAAGNSGAWKAWKAYRSSTSSALTQTTKEKPSIDSQDEWRWDGVWEQRVRRGIESSVSEAVLFGSANVDELPRFLDLDEETLKDVHHHISSQV